LFGRERNHSPVWQGTAFFSMMVETGTLRQGAFLLAEIEQTKQSALSQSQIDRFQTSVQDVVR
jgi:hypothetical protein